MILCRSLNSLRASRMAALPSLPVRINRSASPCRPFAAIAARKLCTGRDPSVNYKSHWGIGIVPQEKAFVIERFGRYLKTIQAGIHLLIPFVDRIAYVHSLEGRRIPIRDQPASTKDGADILIDSTLFVKLVDPKLAPYGVEDPIDAVIRLAHKTIRSELGKITLDKTQECTLDEKIMLAINDAVKDCGFTCLCYEKTISPPGVRPDMDVYIDVEPRLKGLQIRDGESFGMEDILSIIQAALKESNSIEVYVSAKEVEISFRDSNSASNDIVEEFTVSDVVAVLVPKAKSSHGSFNGDAITITEAPSAD